MRGPSGIPSIQLGMFWQATALKSWCVCGKVCLHKRHLLACFSLTQWKREGWGGVAYPSWICRHFGGYWTWIVLKGILPILGDSKWKRPRGVYHMSKESQTASQSRIMAGARERWGRRSPGILSSLTSNAEGATSSKKRRRSKVQDWEKLILVPVSSTHSWDLELDQSCRWKKL